MASVTKYEVTLRALGHPVSRRWTLSRQQARQTWEYLNALTDSWPEDEDEQEAEQ